MGRESRNNQVAQAAREGKLISRASMMGRFDRALENHATALRMAFQKIDELEKRIAAIETLPAAPVLDISGNAFVPAELRDMGAQC